MTASSMATKPQHRRGNSHESSSTSPLSKSGSTSSTSNNTTSTCRTTPPSTADNNAMVSPSSIVKSAKMPPRHPNPKKSSPTNAQQQHHLAQKQKKKQHQQKQGTGGDPSSRSKPDAVPHVVRVTFLGVAGILAKPPTSAGESTSSSASGTATSTTPLHVGSSPQSSLPQSFSVPPSSPLPDHVSHFPQHPSLLFPTPNHLRVVATISRTRTARGIPSGMSKCLVPSRGPAGSSSTSSAPSSVQNSNISKNVHGTSDAQRPDNTGSAASVSSATRSTHSKPKPSDKSIGSTASPTSRRDPSTGLELFNDPRSTGSKGLGVSFEKGGVEISGTTSPAFGGASISSKSQTMTTSPSHLQRGRSGGSHQTQLSNTISTFSMELDEKEESIEIIRPKLPGEEVILGEGEASFGASGRDEGGIAGGTDESGDHGSGVIGESVAGSIEGKRSQNILSVPSGDMSVKTTKSTVSALDLDRATAALKGKAGDASVIADTVGSEQGGSSRGFERRSSAKTDSSAPHNPIMVPDRFVAIWDEDAKYNNLLTRKTRAPSPSDGKGAGKAGDTPPILNFSNTIAFEAELRPSQTDDPSPKSENAQKAPADRSAMASGTYAPKSFCVTVGLIPDVMKPEKPAGTSSSSGEMSPGKPIPGTISPKDETPSFAIPVGFANLVVTGEETLDGKRSQIDLPLSSLSQFMGTFGNAQQLEFPFPLIDFGTDGGKSKVKAKDVDTEPKKGVEYTKEDEAKSKPKKKSIVSRMFSRSKNAAAKTTPTKPDDIQEENDEKLVYSGEPQSIFRLHRPPNARERALFLERYGIDPSGDAVVRIGLEVFPRGSELEKMFRQKQKLKREQQRKKAAATMYVTKSPDRSVGDGSRVRNATSEDKDDFSHGSLSRNMTDGSGPPSLFDDDESLLDSDDDSYYSRSFFSLDSDVSGSTWGEFTMDTEGSETLFSYNSMDDSCLTDSIQSRIQRDRSGAVSPKNVFGRMFDCKIDEMKPLKTLKAEAKALAKELSVDKIASSNSSDTKTKKSVVELTSDLFNCRGSPYDDDVIDEIYENSSVSVASDSTPTTKHDRNSKYNEPSTPGSIGSKSDATENPRIIERTMTNKIEDSPMATIIERTPQLVEEDKQDDSSKRNTEGQEIILD